MTTGRSAFAVDTFELVREQLRCGYLTASGIRATRDAVADQLDDLPDHLAGEANWLLDQWTRSWRSAHSTRAGTRDHPGGAVRGDLA